MAIYRRVNPRVHLSQDYLALSPLAPSGRALWLFLLTCRELTPLPGVILAGPLGLAESLGWPVADLERCLGEVEARGMVRADRAARLVWLTHAHLQEENRPANPNQVLGWRSTWDLIPDCLTKAEIWAAFDSWLRFAGFPDSMSQAFSKACPKPRSNGSGNGSGNGSPNQEQYQDQETVAGDSSSRRERFGEPSSGAPASPDVAPPAEQLTLTPADERTPTDPRDELVLVFPAVGRGPSSWGLSRRHLDELIRVYPALDVEAEARKALAKITTGMVEAKTAKGYPRFLGNWLDRAMERPSGRARTGSGGGATTTEAGGIDGIAEWRARRRKEASDAR